MIELWRGCANAWECDELGHLNVRFYLAKAWEAASDIAARIGMVDAFRSGATATLRPKDIRIRFLAEVHPGAPLFIEGGVTSVGKTKARLVLIMRHSANQKIAAVFTFSIEHAIPGGGSVFAWPAHLRETLSELRCEYPDIANARGLTTDKPRKKVKLTEADQTDLLQIGRGRISQSDCDAYGIMRPEFLIGKISDSVSNFADAFPEQTQAHAAGGGRVGGALLEGRIAVRRWPRSGDGYSVRSGLQSANENVRTLIHWVFDEKGRLLWSMQGVATIMDLDARRIKKVDADTLKALNAMTKTGLAL